VLFTVPNQFGVACNACIAGTLARDIAPAIGWTPSRRGQRGLTARRRAR
jgi:hypothetical protein